MHICHVNLAKGYRGGERQTELLIRALWDLDINQSLIARKDSPLVDNLKDIPNLKVYPIGKPYFVYLYACRDADLLHAHEAKAGQFAYLRLKARGTPYIITRRVPNKLRTNFFTARIYRSAAKLVALSEAIRKSIHDLDASLSVDIVPSMVSQIPGRSSDPNIKERYQDKFLIGHIGAMVNKHKGQKYIVQAARRLETRYPDIYFLLLGQGRDEDKLMQMSRNMKNIEFLGFKRNVGDYLAVFDIFVFPSLEEGLGSTLLDAMSYGLPIVASNVGGIPEIIVDRVNGLLVPPADSYALTEAILDLKNNSELRAFLSKNNREAAKDYYPQTAVQKYLPIYQSTLRVKP